MLREIAEALTSVSSELRALNDNRGSDGQQGMNPSSPLHNAAWSLRLIARVLETETHYFEKAEARLKEIGETTKENR